METGAAIAFALVGMFVAALGVFFFGELALMFAILLIGVAILALATEMESPTLAPPSQPFPPFRFACPGCGGDVQWGQATCPVCGVVLPGAPATGQAPASQFCASCGAHYPADYKLCPKDGSPLKALV